MYYQPLMSPVSDVSYDDDDDLRKDECNTQDLDDHMDSSIANANMEDLNVGSDDESFWNDWRCFLEGELLRQNHDANNHCQWPEGMTSGSSSGSPSSSTHSSPVNNWLSNLNENVTSLTGVLPPHRQEVDTTITTTQTAIDDSSDEAEEDVSTNTLMDSSDPTSANYCSWDQSTDLGLFSDLSFPLIYQNEDFPDAQLMNCKPSTSTESSMFLPEPLQSGSGNRGCFEPQPIPNPSIQTYSTCDMTELRNLLSYPPMSPMTSTGTPSSTSAYSSTSASSSSPSYSGGEVYYKVQPYYNQDHTYHAQHQQDSDTTATFYNGSQTQRKTVVVVNSTTLSSNWPSHETTSTSRGPGGPTKTIKRSKKQPEPREPKQLKPKQPKQLKPKQKRARRSPKKSLRFKCRYCNKGFDDTYSRKVHHRTHTNERPFPCTVCPNKRFKQNAHLEKHYNSKTHIKKAAQKMAQDEEQLEDNVQMGMEE